MDSSFLTFSKDFFVNEVSSSVNHFFTAFSFFFVVFVGLFNFLNYSVILLLLLFFRCCYSLYSTQIGHMKRASFVRCRLLK